MECHVGGFAKVDAKACCILRFLDDPHAVGFINSKPLVDGRSPAGALHVLRSLSDIFWGLSELGADGLFLGSSELLSMQNEAAAWTR